MPRSLLPDGATTAFAVTVTSPKLNVVDCPVKTTLASATTVTEPTEAVASGTAIPWPQPASPQPWVELLQPSKATMMLDTVYSLSNTNNRVARVCCWELNCKVSGS
jgi:hypothetical protein